MNKNLIIGASVLLVVGLLAYFLMGGDKEPVVEDEPVVVEEVEVLPTRLVFYHIKSCRGCKNKKEIFDVLKAENMEGVEIKFTPARYPESRKAIKANKLGTHGCLLTNPEGKVVWSLAGDDFTREDLLKALETVSIKNLTDPLKPF
jgi:hypothetical protein